MYTSVKTPTYMYIKDCKLLPFSTQITIQIVLKKKKLQIMFFQHKQIKAQLAHH